MSWLTIDGLENQFVVSGESNLPSHPVCETVAPTQTDTMTVERYRNGKRVVERWDTVFDALSAEPRRQLVVSLRDADGEPVSLPEAAVNPNVPVDPGRLRIRLRHHHLPLLADNGFVEWDDEPLRAYRGPRFDEAAIVFEALYVTVVELPEQLVHGCNRLERERQEATWTDG